jgi:N-acetylneuraminate synthase
MDGMLGKKLNAIKIGNRYVGEGYPCYLIGEVGLNHQGDVNSAIQLIDIAVDAGMDAVKLQKRTLNKIYRQDVLDDPNTYEEGFRYLIPILKETEFGRKEYDIIYDHCIKRGIDFICTPFDEEAVDFLRPYDLPAFKIASGDMNNLILLEKVIGEGKPLIISTGMGSLEEIDRVGAFLNNWDVEVVLLHAISAYPTPVSDTQLNMIKALSDRYGIPIGLSSHEIGIDISVASVAVGACVIERHITLDKRQEGPDHAASLEPNELREMVKKIRFIEEAMGTTQKKVSRIVIRNKETLSKSLVAAIDIKKGTPISRSMVAAKGPGKGISPLNLYDLLGKVAKRNILLDDYFMESDIEDKVDIENYIPNFETKWGFKGRFHDLDDYNSLYAPKFVEVHLNDKDLEYPFEEIHAGKKYPFEIILHYPTYWHRSVVDVASVNEAERKEHIKVIQMVIDLSKRIAPFFEGKPAVVVHMGGMDIYEVKDNRHILELAYDSMRQFKTEGVTFYAENNPPRPWYFSGQWYDNAFCSPYEMVDFCKHFDVPMCFDFSHAKLYCNVTGFDFDEYVKIVAPVTKHLHICDAYGIDGEGMQIDEGEIDMQKTINILEEHGDLANMTWTPEIWQGHNNRATGFLIGFNRLRKITQLKSL